MKLPEIKYSRAVQSLGRRSNIYSEIETSRVIAGAVSGITKDLVSMANDYEAQQTKMETANANLATAKATAQWTKDNAFKKEYSADEVPEDIRIRDTEVLADGLGNTTEVSREVYPEHEVKADVYKKFMQGQIDSGASRITNPAAASEWKNRQEIALSDVYSGMQLASIQQQNDAIKLREGRNIIDAIESNKPSLAKQLIKQSDQLSADEKANFIDENETQEEKHVYNEILIQSKTRDMESEATQALTALTTDYAGKLTDTEVLSYSASMKRIIVEAQSKREAKTAIQNKAVFDTADRLTALAWTGTDIAPQISESILQSIKTKDPMRYAKLTRALNYSGYISKFNKIGTVDMQGMIDQVNSAAANTSNIEQSLELYELANNLTKVRPEIEARRLIDPVGEAYNTGMLPRHDLDPGDSNSVQVRIMDVEEVQRQWGTPLVYMRPEEVDDLAVKINSATVKNKLNMALQLNDIWDDRSDLMWQQLEQAKVGDSLPAAAYVAKFNKQAAYAILNGEQLGIDRPQSLAKVNNEIDAAIDERLMGVYPNDPFRRSSVRKAIKDSYRWSTRGEEVKRVSNSILDPIVDQVALGKPIEYQGSIFPTPHPALKKSGFNNWIKNADKTYIDTLGDPAGYSNSELLNLIRNGRRQIESLGHNQNAVFDPDGIGPGVRQYVLNKDGSLFIWSYDKDYNGAISKSGRAQAKIAAETAVKMKDPEYVKKMEAKRTQSEIDLDMLGGSITSLESTGRGKIVVRKEAPEGQKKIITKKIEKGTSKIVRKKIETTKWKWKKVDGDWKRVKE